MVLLLLIVLPLQETHNITRKTRPTPPQSPMSKGGIFEAGFGEKVAFSWPSVDRFGKYLGGLITLGQVKSVPNFC